MATQPPPEPKPPLGPQPEPPSGPKPMPEPLRSLNKWLMACAASVIAIGVQAADKAATPRQQLAASCGAEADARGMKAQDRARFVSSCLSEGRKREKQATKACSEAAAYKKTHERKGFMAACLER
jgi:psiF repeat